MLAQSGVACTTGAVKSSLTPGRISARPRSPRTQVTPGEHRLELDTRRDGVLYVPRSYKPEVAAPLVLMLHGAGGTGRHMAFTFEEAERAGALVLAPDSRDRRTWDVILGGWGPDVAFLDRALDQTFERCAVDPRRLGIGGFSDGASYALSVGLASGDLFTHIVAYSPGFVAQAERRGRPGVFISHGTGDDVLPIEATSRRIVPQLKRGGYDLTYREFAGGHTIPGKIIGESFGWLAGSSQPSA